MNCVLSGNAKRGISLPSIASPFSLLVLPFQIVFIDHYLTSNPECNNGFNLNLSYKRGSVSGRGIWLKGFKGGVACLK